jgi:peptide/nickel transport system ATP-binding protein
MTEQVITDTTVVEISDLRVEYRTRDGFVKSLSGVDLNVTAGQVVGIVGESGSGKSTLASALIGTLAPNAVVTGTVIVAGTPMLTAPLEARRRVRRDNLGVISQNPITSMDPTRTIGKAFADVGASVTEASAALKSVGLSDPGRLLSSYPHQLSGGMAQRVAIALAVIRHPKLLIADEPTSALDAEIADTVLEILVETARRQGAALVLVTHDLTIVERYCERVVVMKNGEVVESGRVADVLTNPEAEYTRALLGAMATLHGQPPRDKEPSGGPVITLEDVSVSFSSGPAWARVDKHVLNRFSLSINEGEMVGLVGPSGSGKTTISRMLLGLQRADTGAVLMDGRPLRSPRKGKPGAVQVVLQHPDWALNPSAKVGISIAEPLAITRGERGAAARRKVLALMTEMGLDESLADRYPHELSGGQRQRASIARALIAEPRLIVFDEAVSSLDVSVQAQVLRLIDSLRQQFRFSGLFVSHDRAAVEYISDRVIDLRNDQHKTGTAGKDGAHD